MKCLLFLWGTSIECMLFGIVYRCNGAHSSRRLAVFVRCCCTLLVQHINWIQNKIKNLLHQMLSPVARHIASCCFSFTFASLPLLCRMDEWMGTRLHDITSRNTCPRSTNKGHRLTIYSGQFFRVIFIFGLFFQQYCLSWAIFLNT